MKNIKFENFVTLSLTVKKYFSTIEKSKYVDNEAGLELTRITNI